MALREAIARGLVAAVLQTGGLLEDLTVAEVLERAGIANRRVGRCSGGEQQRLRFAMALLPDPELLVLDEPTTGMDVEGRRSSWGAIRADAARGRTVLFATHHLEEADLYADRVVMVAHGRVVADGTAAPVRAMVSGRTLRATLPSLADGGPGGSSGAGRLLDALRALPGVASVEERGEDVTVHAEDTDAVARHPLTATDARDLEIAARGLEVRRVLRNRRTLVFTLVVPCVFFLIFGLQGDFVDQSAGRGNVTGCVMVSMALRGAALATTTGGSMVSLERSLGWGRQLRLTPLSPWRTS